MVLTLKKRPGALATLLLPLALSLTLAGGLTVPVTDAFAQASLASGGTIERIEIEGAQRVEPTTVEVYLGLKAGDPFDPIVLDQALKALFNTGLFADASFRREGNALVVTVVENPLVNQVAYEGNKRVEDTVLESETQLRARTIYTRTKAQSDAQRIIDIYRRQGYFAATVEPKLIQLDQNRVDVVYEINEGAKTGIASINFVGNRAFSDSSLRTEITTAESAFWRFLSSTDAYDPDRLNFDRELLRRFYLSEGYADFRVLSVVAELAPDRSGFLVTFTMEEGEPYTFGVIDVSSTLKNLDLEAVRSELSTVEGDDYDASKVDDTIALLTDYVGSLGYAFVDINPVVNRDPANRTIGITYEINEGPKVFVERIDIEGNVRTLDEVVRREFRLVEGDAFNTTKMRRSKQRIENLGFFRTVNVTTEPGSTPDKTVVIVEVEEQSTGDFTFGAGFSTDSGPLGNVAVRERNLLGRGQDLRLNFTLSGVSSQIDLSFTEPYFLNRNLSAGFDLFRTTKESDSSDYSEERIGGGVRFGFSWSEELRQVVRYTIEYKTITDVGSGSSAIIKDDEGSRLKSAVGQTLTYDTRNSRFAPSSGFILSLDSEFAGLGGDSSFVKNTFTGAVYFELLDDVILKVGGEAGAIVAIGEDTRVSDRYFVGGANLRGFAVGGVGPRDRSSEDALGGKQYYTGTVEVLFPLGLPEEFQIKGRAFADVGAAWGIDGDTTNVDDTAEPRASVGIGLNWNSPFGPLAVDFGFPLLQQDFDETESFRFNFGTQF